MYDPSTLVLTLNSEGMCYPQKLLYIQQQQGGGIVARKYKFFSENVIRSATSLSSDYVYTANIKGQISRISKHDICRNQIRLKEKLKNKQVHKVSGVDDDDPAL